MWGRFSVNTRGGGLFFALEEIALVRRRILVTALLVSGAMVAGAAGRAHHEIEVS